MSIRHELYITVITINHSKIALNVFTAIDAAKTNFKNIHHNLLRTH